MRYYFCHAERITQRTTAVFQCQELRTSRIFLAFVLFQRIPLASHELATYENSDIMAGEYELGTMAEELAGLRLQNKVKLNVGGMLFQTTLGTLCKDPDSMLAAMFSGRFGEKPDEKDGTYFIDRDGDLFRYILGYLRNGTLICPDDTTIRCELLAEADFYQLQGLIDELAGKNSIYEVSSVVMNTYHEEILKSWLPSNVRFSLLYRASSQMNCPRDFHRCSDNKGPSLVLIKSGSTVLGGYTEASWKSPTFLQALPDPCAFLFTLGNSSTAITAKFDSKFDSRGERGGIRCVENYGPCFGTRSFYDLQVIVGLDGKWIGREDLGYCFRLPWAGTDSSSLTGKSPFSIDELEVFAVR